MQRSELMQRTGIEMSTKVAISQSTSRRHFQHMTSRRTHQCSTIATSGIKIASAHTIALANPAPTLASAGRTGCGNTGRSRQPPLGRPAPRPGHRSRDLDCSRRRRDRAISRPTSGRGVDNFASSVRTGVGEFVHSRSESEMSDDTHQSNKA